MASNSNDEIPNAQANPQQPPTIIVLGHLPDGFQLDHIAPNNATRNDVNDEEDEGRGRSRKNPVSSTVSSLGGVPIASGVVGTDAGRNNLAAPPPSVLAAVAVILLSFWYTAFGGGGFNENDSSSRSSGSDSGSRRRKPVSDENKDFTLDKVGGLDEQIAYLKRAVILPLVRPEVIKGWGVRPPKGIMFYGPPGTGKTFLAKALVNELQKQLKEEVTFIYRKGGDMFSMWFGESEENLREVFAEAKEWAPSVILFDEIDALCPSRDEDHGIDVYSQIVTCFLGEMDGLDDQKVFVIGATNRLDALDPAVLRPGRFDKHIAFDFPDETGRGRILRIHTRNWCKQDQIEDDLLIRLAHRTVGYSGADLEKLCTEVVYVATEDNGGKVDNNMAITEQHWLQAIAQMQPTASNNFGSTLIIPSKPNPVISLLIQPVVNQAMGKVGDFLTPDSLEFSSLTLVKSFLLYCTPDMSKDFMENHILQGILSHQEFKKVSLYQLSPTAIKESILTGRKPTLLSAVNAVVHQALENRSGNLSCVVCLGINEILQMASDEVSSSLILRSLSKVRGPTKLILATSSIPPDQIEDARVNDLFHEKNRLQVENLGRTQLQDLFQKMFQAKIKGKRQQENLIPVLNQVAEKAARYSDKDNYDHVLNLYDTLAQVDIRSEDMAALNSEYQEILEEYQKTKLRF